MSSFTEILQAHVLDVHVPNILIGISASVEIPLITILARRIGATHSEVASFVLVSALCRSALDIPCGILVEYVGVRNMMLASLLLNVFASLIGFMTRDAMYLTMYCVVSGISLGAFFLSRHIFVAGISSKRYRGMLMSFLSGLLRWSHVIGPTFSGFIASSTGDIQDAFIMSAVASAAAFASISATIGARYQARCAQSCTVSCAPTPCTSETDVGSVDVVVDVDVGEEEVLHAPPTTTTTTLPSTTMMVHPRLTAGEEHHFRLATLWHTCVDHFTIIWRLGLYVILFGALRSNRKLMLVVAGMAHNLSDAQLSYLLSFSFAFDAVLFPLGGILMDVLGRQYAMVPVALGLSAAFLILPMCSTTWELYTAASIFGVADALGCGLVMTITADRAPSQHGAPFFGIIRTLEDLGHVVGAGSASYLLRTTNIGVACEVLALQGIITACWGLWGVPRDVNPLESSRSHHHHHHHHDDDDAHEHAQLCTRHVSYGTTATTHPPVLV